MTARDGERPYKQKFQSLLGFLMRCNDIRRRPSANERCFNHWFLCAVIWHICYQARSWRVSTYWFLMRCKGQPGFLPRPVWVSIPSFNALQSRLAQPAGTVSCFNLLGFLMHCVWWCPTRPTVKFQSLLGLMAVTAPPRFQPIRFQATGLMRCNRILP